jgi:hypothetical protein
MMNHWKAIKPLLISDPAPGTDFLIGLLTEAVVDVYEVSGDTSCISTLKNVADKITAYTCNSSYSFAWLWNRTRNPIYRAKMTTALAYVDSWSTLFAHHEKDFAVEERNIARVFYELQEAAAISIENGNGKSEIKSNVEIVPNPFNPITTIKLNGIRNNSSNECLIKVFDSRGRIVADLSHLIKNNAVVFDAKNLNSGVYFIKVDLGNKNSTKTRALLVK